MVFSLDYDQSCLRFDPEGVPGSLNFTVPETFAATGFFFDARDVDAEIDIVIAAFVSKPPPIPDGVVVEITFGVTCQATSGDVIATVAFSTEPRASYSDPLAQDVDGWTRDGSVRITGN
jgi:hypothetical protein